MGSKPKGFLSFRVVCLLVAIATFSEFYGLCLQTAYLFLRSTLGFCLLQRLLGCSLGFGFVIRLFQESTTTLTPMFGGGC